MRPLTQIVQALALVVSALPAEQRAPGLTALLSPLVIALQQHMQQQQPAAATEATATANGGDAAAQPAGTPPAGAPMAVALVDRMSILFRCVRALTHGSAICAAVYQA
jgi:hypothetical protein